MIKIGNHEKSGIDMFIDKEKASVLASIYQLKKYYEALEDFERDVVEKFKEAEDDLPEM